MSLEQWQRALRMQAGAQAAFRVRNLEEHPIFSSFAVTNPATRQTYRVAIRGSAPGLNYCSCADFATNRLGLCKHIAFLLHRLRRSPAGARALDRGGWRPPFSEIAVAYDGPPRLRLHVGGDAPPAFQRLAARKAGRDGTIKALPTVAALAEAAAQARHELRVYDDARQLLARHADDAERRRLLRRRYPAGAADAGMDALVLSIGLHPYQREGIWFLAERGRALLADDMGLGKTLQAIAAARLLGSIGTVQRVLVVCPASVVGQWVEEIARFTGIAALALRGPMERRRLQWAESGSAWKVATYDVLHRDADAINAWGPDLILLDEAQRIKNWPTRAAKAVRRLTASLRFLLTGTPLENKLDELHALVEVVDPHLLGPLQAFKEAHAVREVGSSKIVGYQDLDRIGKTLEPVLLRRTRATVMASLPGRTTIAMPARLTPLQLELHEESRAALAQLVKKWRRRGFLTEQEQLRMHKLLLRMRMVCDDLFLIDPGRRSGSKVGQVQSILDQELGGQATKVVVFSSWMDMHALLRERLEADELGYAFLNGSVPSRQRPELIRRFRDDPACRVFLSTDCGATGLNLQCASALINVDLPWNPAVREQRISRIHRQGQQRPVRIYDLLAEDGIEAGIAQLLTFKSDLAAGVLDRGPSSIRLNGSALERMMRTVEAVERSLPARSATGSPLASPPTAAAAPLVHAQTEGDSGVPLKAKASGAISATGVTDLANMLSQASEVFASFAQLAGTMRLRTGSDGARWLQMRIQDADSVTRLQQGLASLHALFTPGPGKPSTPPSA